MKIDIYKAHNFLKALKISNNIRKGEFKQVIVVNKNAKMSKGKLAAQVAHASVLSMLESNEAIVAGWLDNSFPKIVLKVDSASDLLTLKSKCEEEKVPCAIVIDEGRTELSNGTITCLGIGPSTNASIDAITGELGLL